MTVTIAATRSEQIFQRAKQVIPGGVNSPVRSCKAVGCDPVFIDHADGSSLYDVDGNKYIDYIGSWGPMILGHCHPRVMEAIESALQNGTSYGAPCKLEVELAELICHVMPAIEMVRMVNSGTEATMSAIRLARAFTKRDLIVKFDGCYHGHGDSFLVKAGSGLATLGISSSPGVPEEVAKLTLSIPYNDVAALEKTFQSHADKVAAVIIEPIVGNSGLILPADNYLTKVRELCTKHGAVLIFDEVMTGFRVALGGAQDLYKIKPDLTCLGKIIGGGLPVGAYGGRKEIMEMMAPDGPVYQAGTLSGNPLAMAAGLAQIKTLQHSNAYAHLAATTKHLADGLTEAVKESKKNVRITSVSGMISVFFSASPVTDFASAQKCDTELFAKVWKGLLDRGIYWPPSQFETAFISTEHHKSDINATIKAFSECLK